MHDSAYALMERELYALHPAPRRVLDVGSYDVNGSIRPLIEGRGWEYVGLDVRSGPNVAVVTTDPYRFPLTSGTFDTVVSVCALHNVAKPWKLLPEMARVLKPGGVLIVHTIWAWGENAHPADFFRFMPAGLTVLFDECETLETVYAAIENEHDVIGVAHKKVFT